MALVTAAGAQKSSAADMFSLPCLPVGIPGEDLLTNMRRAKLIALSGAIGVVLVLGVFALDTALYCSWRPAVEDLLCDSSICQVPIEKRLRVVLYAFVPVELLRFYSDWFYTRTECAVQRRRTKKSEWRHLIEPRSPFLWREVVLFGNGRKEAEDRYLGKQLHGLQRRWYDDGSLIAEFLMLRGKKTGTARSWHWGGALRTESQWNEGRKHGFSREWDDDGALRCESVWSNGSPVNGMVESSFTLGENPPLYTVAESDTLFRTWMHGWLVYTNGKLITAETEAGLPIDKAYLTVHNVPDPYETRCPSVMSVYYFFQSGVVSKAIDIYGHDLPSSEWRSDLLPAPTARMHEGTQLSN